MLNATAEMIPDIVTDDTRKARCEDAIAQMGWDCTTFVSHGPDACRGISVRCTTDQGEETEIGPEPTWDALMRTLEPMAGILRCGCGRSRASNPGEPGIWTHDFTRYFQTAGGINGERIYRDEIEPGDNGLRHCPNPRCKDILHDDWSVTAAEKAAPRLL